ncbi:MAG: electron transfer flavoprotein subunit beta, partial [Candidatus Omnitrophota bacterium]
DIPQVTYVKKIEEIKDSLMRAERLVESGFEIIQSPLPCLITVVKEINTPRLPSLKGKMKAKSAKITVFGAADLGCDPRQIGLEGSPTRVVKVFSPPPRTGGVKLEGEPFEVVDKLVELLKREAL